MEHWHFLVDFSDIYLESIHFNLYVFVSQSLSVLLPGLERNIAVVPVLDASGRGGSFYWSLAIEYAWHSPTPLLCCRYPLWEQHTIEVSVCHTDAKDST